tara:strand:+ start:185 stop:712 length:528 start_codon:yes stop_codon:yes gene_type:complete
MANALVDTRAKESTPVTSENIVEIINNLSLEGKDKLCAKINGFDFLQEFLQVHTVGTRVKESISVISKPERPADIPTKECNKKVVYVLTNNRSFKEPWVKIGHSKQFLGRLGTLDTSHPFDFDVEGWVEFDSVKAMKKAEKIAHEMFENCRTNKEFFLVDPKEALRVIRNIKSTM